MKFNKHVKIVQQAELKL